MFIYFQFSPTGNRPCITCRNVFDTKGARALPDGMVGISCPKRADLIFHTNESVFAMADRLKAAIANKKQYERLETTYGLHYIPSGVMYDTSLRNRGIYLPLSHYLRDWMHVIASGGVANVHLGLLLHVLKAHGFTLDFIANAVMAFTLPNKWGKVQRTWITENRLHDDNLASFASTVLALLVILNCFLNDVVKPTGQLSDHILCFGFLVEIVDILRMGTEGAALHVDRLTRLIDLHNQLFIVLYEFGVKSKFHHLHHIVDHINWIGKCLSCFVTERKHRSSKSSALYVFRFMESSVLHDQINKCCESMFDANSSLFRRTNMLTPTKHDFNGRTMYRSSAALLDCGIIKPGDIVWLNSDIVGRVVAFWGDNEYGEDFCVELDAFDAVHEGENQYFEDSSSRSHIAPAHAILDACIWVYRRAGLMRVITPFAARVR